MCVRERERMRGVGEVEREGERVSESERERERESVRECMRSAVISTSVLAKNNKFLYLTHAPLSLCDLLCPIPLHVLLSDSMSFV